MQPDGLVSKCDWALTYVKLEKTKSGDGSKKAAIDTAIERIATWKHHWRKEKGRKRAHEVAECMEDVPDIETTKIIRHQPLWQDFDDVRFQELKIATATIAAALLYQSVQRPGAVTGCTLSEYAKATYITGERVWSSLTRHPAMALLCWHYNITSKTGWTPS